MKPMYVPVVQTLVSRRLYKQWFQLVSRTCGRVRDGRLLELAEGAPPNT